MRRRGAAAGLALHGVSLLMALRSGTSKAGGGGGLDGRPQVAWPSLTLLDGSTLPPEFWRDQAAVVVFWSTECSHCQRHNAHIDQLHRRHQSDGLGVLGVALEADAAKVRAYMQRQRYGFPVTLDGGRLRQQFTARRVIPMTCVLDRGGRLLQAIPGEMSSDDVMNLALVLARQAG